MTIITIEEIIKSKNLNLLFNKLVKSDSIIKQIRNFEYIDFNDIEPFLSDKKIIIELEKYGRHSIIKKMQ